MTRRHRGSRRCSDCRQQLERGEILYNDGLCDACVRHRTSGKHGPPPTLEELPKAVADLYAREGD